MAGALGRLTVALGLDAGEFTRGLTKAEYEASQFGARVGRAVGQGIDLAVASLGAMAAAGAAAFAAADRLIGQAADYQDLAEKIGGSAEAIASFGVAAGTAGTSIDTIAAASVRLTKSLVDVDDESKAAGAALASLGIPLKTFKALAPEEQIEAVAKALAGFEDGAAKTAVAVALFGKSGAELLPFLKALEEQGGRQVILTDAQIKQADEYADKIARVKAEVNQQAQAFATRLVPVMSDAFDVAVKLARSFVESDVAAAAFRVTIGALVTTFQTVAVLAANVGFVFTTLGREIGSVAAQFGAFARGDFDQIKFIREAVAADTAAARKELDAFERQVLSIGKTIDAEYSNEGRSRTPAKRALQFAGADDAAKKAAEAAKKEQERQLREAERIARARSDLRNKEAEEIEKFLRDQANAAAEADRKRLAGFLGETAGAKLAKQRDDVQYLTDAFEQGRISEEQYLEAVSARLDLVAEKTEKGKTLAEELGLSFTSAFEKAVIEGRNLSDTLKALAQDIAQIVLRKTVTEPLGNALVKGLGGLDFLGGLFGGGKAAGGPVMAGALYRVNENGPEMLDVAGKQYLMMGNKGGTVSPQYGSGGGGLTIVVQGGGNRGEIYAAVQQGVAASLGAVAESQRRGGPIR